MGKINNKIESMTDMVKIYTRTGDKGKTSLFGGRRVLKSHERVEAYGTIDELNSSIGVVLATFNKKDNKSWNILENIQHDLFLIGSTLANPQNNKIPKLEKRVAEFERMIDEMTGKLPELRNFILPGGHIVGAHLHFVRTVCRRAERKVVGLSQSEGIDDAIRMYLNRLSDLLFTMARYTNKVEGKIETIWINKR